MFFIFLIFFRVFDYCFLSVVKFEWILARHANQSSSSFAYSSPLNFLPQARTHEFAHAPTHVTCHGIVVVAVVHAIVLEQCLHQLWQWLLRERFRQPWTTSHTMAFSQKQLLHQTVVRKIQFRGRSLYFSSCCRGAKSAHHFASIHWGKWEEFMYNAQLQENVFATKSLFAQCPPFDFFSNAL
jgi:hypothetical protein